MGDDKGDGFEQVLADMLFSPPVLSMKVMVPRPLADDFEACARASAALIDDVRVAVADRSLRVLGGIAVTMWAAQLRQARVGDAVPGDGGPQDEWISLPRQELCSGPLPDWADARVYEAVVTVE